MKFSCDRQALINALSTTQKGASGKSTLPILEGILFQVYDNQLTLTGTDMEIGIRTSLPAEVTREGEVVLSANLIAEFVRKLGGDEVFFDKDENHQVVIESLMSKITIKGLPSDEFPAFPEIEGEFTFTIDAVELKNMIRSTIISVATTDTIPVLKGLKMEIEDGLLSLIGLDGYRLSVKKTEPIPAPEFAAAVIVPGTSMSELARLLGNYEGTVTVEFSTTQIFFAFGDTQFTSRILQGEFINYKHIIPTEKTTRVTLERQAFYDCIERAALLAREGKNNLVKMDFNVDEVIITANATDVGEVREILPIQNEGAPLRIAFNSKYYLDVLKVIDDEQITIEMTTSVGPSVIVDDAGNYLYLILPVRLAEEV